MSKATHYARNRSSGASGQQKSTAFTLQTNIKLECWVQRRVVVLLDMIYIDSYHSAVEFPLRSTRRCWLILYNNSSDSYVNWASDHRFRHESVRCYSFYNNSSLTGTHHTCRYLTKKIVSTTWSLLSRDYLTFMDQVSGVSTSCFPVSLYMSFFFILLIS